MTCYYYCAYWERLRRETELPRLAQGAADDGGTAGLGCGSVGSSVPSMPEALGSTPALHNPSIVAPGVTSAWERQEDQRFKVITD